MILLLLYLGLSYITAGFCSLKSQKCSLVMELGENRCNLIPKNILLGIHLVSSRVQWIGEMPYKISYCTEPNFSNLAALFGVAKSQMGMWRCFPLYKSDSCIRHHFCATTTKVNWLLLSPCGLCALSCNFSRSCHQLWSHLLGCICTYVCSTYTDTCVYTKSPWLQRLLGLNLLGLDAAELGSMVEQQKFGKKDFPCRSESGAGKSRCRSHFPLYLEAFPYSNAHFYLLSRQCSWIKRDFALLWVH